MGIQVAYYQEEDRLDLIVEDNLDLTLTRQILEACQFIDERLLTCVIDCSGVVRIFDSGLALLMLLLKKLRRFHTRHCPPSPLRPESIGRLVPSL